MKKLLATAAILCGFILAAQEVKPFNAIYLKSGDLAIRLDGRKFDNMNSIKWKGHDLCVDNVGSHYGTVVMFQDTEKQGFIGSGHKETGIAEKLTQLSAQCDGKPVTLTEGATINGAAITFNKKSLLRTMKLDYTLKLQDNIIFERSTISADTDQKIHIMYHFMHPWSPAFTNGYGKGLNGKEHKYDFSSSGKFFLQTNAPVAIWHNAQNNVNIVTVITPIAGTKSVYRMVWDRTVYRKDYIVDYSKSIFPANNSATYEARTAFFTTQPGEDWIAAGTKLAEKLRSVKF